MRSKKDKQGFALIGLIATAVVGLIGYKIYVGSQPKPGPDNCVGRPGASTVIVVDRSEGIGAQTLNEIRARALAYVTDSVQDNERVTVFTVDQGSQTALAPLVSLCRPRKDGSRVTENIRVLQKQYEARYRAPLDSVLRLPPGESLESPLAQAMTDISLSEYLNSKRNTLLVFSDMLENTGRFSLYTCKTPSTVIQDYRASRIGSQERPRFKNATVRLNIIPRWDQSRAALECRDKLWLWFFGDNPGANAGLTLDYLPGGPSVRPGGARS
jgi:hypothetical protein